MLVPGQLGAVLLVVHLLNAGQVAGVMLCQLSLQRAVQRCGLLLLLRQLLLLVAKVVVLGVEATAGEAAAVLLAIGAPPDFAVAALERHVCVKEKERGREGGYYYWRMQISCVNHLINCLICSTALNSFNLMQLTPA